MGLLVDAVEPRLRGDGDERMRVELRVRDAEHQVDRARSERGQAHAGLARERAVRVGHERRASFVPRGHEADRRVDQRIDHVEVLLAREAEHELDALVLEALDDQPGNGLCAVRGFHVPLRLPVSPGRYARPMEFRDVVRHRRMVRRFDQGPVPRDVVDRIIDVGRRAPSAGFSQGLELLVLDTPETVAEFWETTRDPEFGWEAETVTHGPTVLILPAAGPHALPRALRAARQDRVRDGRGGELARAASGRSTRRWPRC